MIGVTESKPPTGKTTCPRWTNEVVILVDAMGGGKREGFDHGLGGPGGRGSLRDVEVKDFAAFRGQDQEDLHYPKLAVGRAVRAGEGDAVQPGGTKPCPIFGKARWPLQNTAGGQQLGEDRTALVADSG